MFLNSLSKEALKNTNIRQKIQKRQGKIELRKMSTYAQAELRTSQVVGKVRKNWKGNSLLEFQY